MHSKKVIGLGEKLKTRNTKQKSLIKKLNPKLHAFITINSKTPTAKPSLAVKDNLCVKAMRATSSSKILENYIAPYDATVVEKLRQRFYIIGKTAHDPFGAGSSGTTSGFGVTRNPHDSSLVPGGSSSGNAVALATGMCDFAIGTDTFGSVRAPAAFCGVVGLRPTYGLVSRYGLMDLCMSLDTVGPMARDVYGIAYLLSLITGKDKKDCTTVKAKRADYCKSLGKPTLNGKTVGVFTDLKMDKEVKALFEKTKTQLAAHGTKITEFSFKKLHYAVPAYYLLMFAEFSSAMQKFDGITFGKQRELLSREVKRRILLGTRVTLKEHRAKWYSLALKGKTLVENEVEKLFDKCDFILTPTMPTLPWKIGSKKAPVEEYMMDLCTGFPCLAGIPAISIPVGKTIGMQLCANKLEEKSLLRASQEVMQWQK